jgi:hypothetical protein
LKLYRKRNELRGAGKKMPLPKKKIYLNLNKLSGAEGGT